MDKKLKLIEATFEIIRRDNMFAATVTQMYDNDKLNTLFSLKKDDAHEYTQTFCRQVLYMQGFLLMQNRFAKYCFEIFKLLQYRGFTSSGKQCHVPYVYMLIYHTKTYIHFFEI